MAVFTQGGVFNGRLQRWSKKWSERTKNQGSSARLHSGSCRVARLAFLNSGTQCGPFLVCLYSRSRSDRRREAPLPAGPPRHLLLRRFLQPLHPILHPCTDDVWIQPPQLLIGKLPEMRPPISFELRIIDLLVQHTQRPQIERARNHDAIFELLRRGRFRRCLLLCDKARNPGSSEHTSRLLGGGPCIVS